MNETNREYVPQYAMIPAELRESDISNSEFRLYYLLATFRNEKTGLICPDEETLASLLRKDERTVRRGLKSLCDKGLIEKTQRYNKSNVYILPHLERLKNKLKESKETKQREAAAPSIDERSPRSRYPSNSELMREYPDLFGTYQYH
jgi:predicted transcriptional regulator